MTPSLVPTAAPLDRMDWTIDQILAAAGNEPPFLVEGLLHSQLTLVWGKSMVGKSVFIRALIAALLNGDREFLGQAILRRPDGVLVLTADGGDDQTYAAALKALLAPDAIRRVRVVGWHDKAWKGMSTQERQAVIRQRRIGLVVLDNLTAAMVGGESFNEDKDVRHYLDILGDFTRAGAAVVLVHHQTEKGGQGAESSSPMGASMLVSAPRLLLRLRSKGPGLEIRAVSNSGPPLVVTYGTAWNDGVPALVPGDLGNNDREPRPARNRDKEALRRQAKELAAAPVSARANPTALGRWLYEHGPDHMRPNSSGATKGAGAGRTKVKRLIDGGWLAAGPPIAAGPQVMTS